MTSQTESTVTSNRLADQVNYDPNNLLDALIEKLGLKNDAALSRALEVAPPVISKIRHRRLPVGASLLIRMHEVSDLSIKDLRILMGDRRDKFRISDKQFKPKPGEGGAGDMGSGE
jgi:plasmid maintenance system antidote protein VapI